MMGVIGSPLVEENFGSKWLELALHFANRDLLRAIGQKQLRKDGKGYLSKKEMRPYYRQKFGSALSFYARRH